MMMNKMKPLLNILALFALMLSAPTQAVNYSYIVGNLADNADHTKDDHGPTADAVYSMTRIMGKTVAYHTESGLRELVVYDWGGMDTATDGGGYAYCNATDSFDAPLRMKRGYGTPYGQTPDGHSMWKTNITGLYFAVEVYQLYTSFSTLSNTLPLWFDNNYVDLHFTPIDGSSLKTNCDKTIVNTYAIAGGIGFATRIHLYADNTFKPDRSTTITDVNFPTPDGYDFEFENTTTMLGAGNHAIKFSFDTTGFNAVWPSCSASTVSGTNVKGSTLDFGAFYAKEIIAGLSAVPFQINLSDCAYVKNIEVKLASTAIGKDTSLLSNTLTGNTAASGIGVEIQGVQTNLSNQMVLLPGNANSVYKYSPYASQDAYIDSDNTYTANTLNFLATLKQDKNQTITPGNFKATGIFQITYP
ncbi:fimbrial protein [Salmonella enterica]|nr:fimbrial protein [Salmonella enterica]